MEENKPESIDHNDQFSDEVTKRKIHRHLTNINDTISEQDIKNIKTDISSSVDEDSSDPEKENSKKELNKKDDNKDDDGGRISTPWNIIE